MKYTENRRGYAMVVTTVFLLLVSLMSYLVMTHTSGVKSAGKYLKNADTAKLMLSLRNLLVDDAIAQQRGGLIRPDIYSFPASLPSSLIGPNYNPPVNDVWGSEIKYCVYSETDPLLPGMPASGLAGRLLSAGENRKLQTVCTDVIAQGDDIAIDIFAADIEGVFTSERSWSPPVMISANNLASYLVREDGTVWAWGDNAGYALKDGTSINRRLPIQPQWSVNANDFVLDVKEVSAGTTNGFLVLSKDSTVWAPTYQSLPPPFFYQIPVADALHVQNVGPGAIGEPNHGIALKSDGTVWAWGYNAPSRSLMKAGVLSTAISVSVSKVAAGTVSEHAIALLSNGDVWAWGVNTNGQLGNGTTINSISPVQAGISNVVAVSAGTSVTTWTGHSLALKDDGTVWAWGLNSNGRLGDGTTTSRTTPVQVKGQGGIGFLTNVIAIAAGAEHSLALKSDGTVWAWGLNSNGQLGDNTITQRLTPVQTKHPTDPSGNLTGVIAISAGANHSMALKNDGSVWVWGNNQYGQIGDNSTTQRTTPVKVLGEGGAGFLTGVRAISGGGAHSLALKEDGTVRAWGLNSSGQLGNGTTMDTTPRAVPVQVMADALNGSPLTGAIAISAGGSHSMALKSDGTVWAWGSNSANYELGDEPLPPLIASNKNIPVQVTRLSGLTLTSARDPNPLSAGGGNSFAIGPDSTLWTWGKGWPSILRPARIWGQDGIGALANITQISISWSSATSYHCLALDSNGTVWAWGKNTISGRLGDGTTTDRIYPVQVIGLSDVVGVTAGGGHSLALKSDGTVWAWGLNSYGQLGDGTTTSRTTPVQVKGQGGIGFLAGVKSISAGMDHSMALKTDGTVWAWGRNTNNQLGDGTTTQRTTPVQVSDISGVKAISAGGSHSLAVRSNGLVWSWGLNSSGQLGNGSWINKTKPANVLHIWYWNPDAP